MNGEVLRYIIRFLLGEDAPESAVSAVGYTAVPTDFPRYKVVILPSGFFGEGVYGTASSLPSLPLREIEGIPLLFGTPETETTGTTLLVHADIIASACFLVSRYEELVRRGVRDEHGRFPGRESLSARAGFLHRPVVDEYGRLLHRWLRQAGVPLPEEKQGIRKIYLTHDVDAPFLYRSWKGFVRSLLDKRGIAASLKGKFGALESDPYYTFPDIFRQDEHLRELVGDNRCRSVYFFIAGGNTKEDKPHYSLRNSDIQQLLRLISTRQALLGLHASYEAGLNPALIAKEKKALEKAVGGGKIHINRHHFLACREPEDADMLEKAGITDDFTLGYADVAGFRLGTSRPVRRINPADCRLSSLVLHPLLIMDCTLDDSKYMNLPFEEAERYCLDLLEQVRQAGGEVSLLWHNNSFTPAPGNYSPRLYSSLLDNLSEPHIHTDSKCNE
ncbi:hypothetical protein Barb6_00377 [Bacteroidales bacterium Barb6]|nr:hypothetical protein Barb6_00377 [Bacteroidales bacterium Barb6]